MIIIWGSKLYGKTDEVPGLFHVATQFGHLDYLPLIPMGSHLIFEESDDGWRGVPIGFSFKSFLLTWTRTAALIGMIGMVVASFVTIPDAWQLGNTREVMSTLGITLSICSVWWYLCFGKACRRASYDKAVHLAEKHQLGEQALILIDLHYGQITEDEANDRLQAWVAANGGEEEVFEEDDEFTTSED
jgi:hypothetical protein